MTTATVRTVARQMGVDLASLIAILEYRRPSESETEQFFVETYLDHLPGMMKDGYGNRILAIGENPIVMWSCHTDTVSNDDGKQNIKWSGNELVLNEPKQGQTLGADDGAGLWLLLEMIKENRPGLYIFHRDEEVGGIGSKWIAKNYPELVKDIKMAIAFDRKAKHSIITRQRGRKCCSDEFAKALADKFNETEGLNFRTDGTGVFTDTASYTELIPECTNVSVGYYDEHTSSERLDVVHLLLLREALLALDVSDLPIERDPTEVEPAYYTYGGYASNYLFEPRDQLEKLTRTIENRKWTVAKWLDNMGVTAEAFDKMLDHVWMKDEHQTELVDYFKRNPHLANDEDDTDFDFEDRLWCNSCANWVGAYLQIDSLQDGDACESCFGNDTVVMECEIDLLSGEVVDA